MASRATVWITMPCGSLNEASRHKQNESLLGSKLIHIHQLSSLTPPPFPLLLSPFVFFFTYYYETFFPLFVSFYLFIFLFLHQAKRVAIKQVFDSRFETHLTRIFNSTCTRHCPYPILGMQILMRDDSHGDAARLRDEVILMEAKSITRSFCLDHLASISTPRALPSWENACKLFAWC